jgi:N-acetylneuraminic acid mutarotase
MALQVTRTIAQSAGPCLLAFVLLLAAGATAQQNSASPDPHALMTLQRLLTASAAAPQIQPSSNPNAIMGFESLGTWNVLSNKLPPPTFTVATTTTRTQGVAAYSIANPPELITLYSQPVASTATALTGIGNTGALLQVDVLIPVSTSGGIWAYLSSPSHELYLVSLGYVPLNKYRAGIYNTIGFSIPESVSSALGGATFNDLTFAFLVASPETVTGAYLFDNLRIFSVQLVQTPTGTPPPAGYGGSVNLVVPGNAPVTQTFNLGPTQIPNGFHLKQGTAGATTVQLQLGLDGNPALTCTYGPDSTDSTDESYIFTSCTGGHMPGDLVNANWVYQAIVGGNQAQIIHAQLAQNPMGDVTGAGLLPPMPTFWGDSDTCTPAPVTGTVVTTSTSCANQVAKANQIITTYFNQVNNANPSPNWIATPVPEFALRHGNGTPTTNLKGAQATSTDPLFNTGGDLNPGGSFDAYWLLSTQLTPTDVAGTDENDTYFDANLSAHAVLFGDDVDVVDVTMTADTDSGQTVPHQKKPTSSGSIGLFVFGNEIYGPITFIPSKGFTVTSPSSYLKPIEYDLPQPIEIWIFSITLGATAGAGIDAYGPANVPSGLALNIFPTLSLGAHAYGAVNLYIASGGVDVRVDLIDLSPAVTADADWTPNTNASTCAVTLSGSLNGNVTFGSLGGEVDLEATFGDCPFCYTDSWPLFSWNPLISESWNLFNDTIGPQLIGLPASMCTLPGVTAQISSPVSGATLYSGSPATLQASAITVPPLNTTYNWTFTPGKNASSVTVNSGGMTASPNVTFGAPTSGSTSSWTIGLTVNVSGKSAGGTQINLNLPATPVTISVITPGGPGQSNWVEAPSLLVPSEGLAAAADTQGNIYAIGGLGSSGNAQSTAEMYSPSTNTWTLVAPMSAPRSYLAAAADTQGNIYAIGGNDSSGKPLSTVEMYSPSTNTWTLVAPMSAPRSYLAAAADTQGNIYAIGGNNSNFVEPLNTVEMYSPSTNTWTTLTPMPEATLALAAATDKQGNLYAIGGTSTEARSSNTVEIYSPSTKTWTTVLNGPTASFLGAAADTQGNIYAIGGYFIDGTLQAPLSVVEMYSPSTKTWTPVLSLPAPMCALAAAADTQGNIYAIGGTSGTWPFEPLSTVEMLPGQ